MPQRKAAEKALRQNQTRRQRNLKTKREIKSALKDFKKSLENGNSDSQEKTLRKAYKALDKAATKKMIHPNKAARKKSRLAHRLKQKKDDKAS